MHILKDKLMTTNEKQPFIEPRVTAVPNLGTVQDRHDYGLWSGSLKRTEVHADFMRDDVNSPRVYKTVQRRFTLMPVGEGDYGYNALQRNEDALFQELSTWFDQEVFDLVMEHSPRIARPKVTSAESLIATYEAVRYEVEKNRVICEWCHVNRRHISDLVRYGSHLVDPINDRELLLAGYIGHFLNMCLHTGRGDLSQEVIPPNVLVASTGAKWGGEYKLTMVYDKDNSVVAEATIALQPKAWAVVVLE